MLIPFNLVLNTQQDKPTNVRYAFYFPIKVDKLATVQRIQFRTGCFCNTGACQVSLGLTHDQLMEHIKVHSECN